MELPSGLFFCDTFTMNTDNCVLCTNQSNEQLIWKNEFCRVILANEEGLPGFIRVIWSEHVAEMTDLEPPQRAELMRLIYKIETIVRKVMLPHKINLATLGNLVAHIHWHIIPRYVDDPYFPGSVWSPKVRELGEGQLKGRAQKERLLVQVLQENL